MRKTLLIIIVFLLNFTGRYIFYDKYAEAEQISFMTLKDGLKIVTEESRIVKIARFNEEIAGTEVSIARARFFPSINVYARQTYLANQPGARFGPQEVYTSQKEFLSYGVILYQSLFRGGSDLSLYRSAEKGLEITKNNTRRLKNLVALEFINAYLDLLEIEKLISVSEKEIESLQGHLKDAIAMYEEGLITKNEKLEIEVRLSDAMQRHLSLKNLRSFYLTRLNTMLLLPLDQEVRIEDIEYDDKNEYTPLELQEAWEEAIERRPEIKIIEQEIEATRLQKKAKAGEYYPELFIQAGYDYTENRYQLHEENWSVILGVNINLFKGGATVSEINKIRYREGQLMEEREKLLDEIRLEVKRYFVEFRNALEKIRVTESAVLQAEENLRINRLRFEEGAGKSTDVLDAIALNSMAETNYYRARYELLRAQAGLNYAMGKDLVAIYGGEYGRDNK
ncbi:MAG: TolC family protein [Thermodesulfovibrionales bacterium]|nr:TolC family protein [Thermodesulfovibrionales bacterium]